MPLMIPHTIRLSAALGLLLVAPLCVAQKISRPDPTSPAHPFNTPAAVGQPASAAQFDTWRSQARAALFLPEHLPAAAAHEYGSFPAMPGVIAHRVTYATLYGLRVPAIVYMPEKTHGRVPAIVIAAGHGGSKASWYEIYAGLLYASAGAVVVTFDPVGEGERSATRGIDVREHDTPLPGAESERRMGGLMLADITQAVTYSLSRPDVDPARIAVLGYSMGSFQGTLAAGLDPRIRFLVTSGGGNIDGIGGQWDSSNKPMCQGGPYQALSFLPDKAAVLYALHARVGPTLVLNGRSDGTVSKPHTMESFFDDLNARVQALGGKGTARIDYKFYDGVGHRPSWINRDAAEWLNARLHFAKWQGVELGTLGETHVAEWAKKTGAPINSPYDREPSEGGIRAVGKDFPSPTFAQLQVVPDAEWQANRELYTWAGAARKILDAQGIHTAAPEPAGKN